MRISSVNQLIRWLSKSNGGFGSAQPPANYSAQPPFW